MPYQRNLIPSFPSSLPPKDDKPRRYKDAPNVLTPSGYVVEWCPTHPKATHGTYFQHRLVMECHIGRFLSGRERVHHKNRDRTDNRIENLDLHSSHSEHMRQHWAGKGSNDPKLIRRVQEAAADPTKGLDSLGISPTTIQTICRKHGIEWIPCGQRGAARLLTEQSVREALQGRSTVEAAQHLGVSQATLYNRFSHLLNKRASPGSLDEHKKEILELVYRQRIARTEVARRFGVHEVTVTKSIRRWLEQGAKPDGFDAQSPIPSYRGQRQTRKAQRRAALRKIRAEAQKG